METKHDSVLLEEAIDGLAIVPGDVVVDAEQGILRSLSRRSTGTVYWWASMPTAAR